jgi:hypothetical protein
MSSTVQAFVILKGDSLQFLELIQKLVDFTYEPDLKVREELALVRGLYESDDESYVQLSKGLGDDVKFVALDPYFRRYLDLGNGYYAFCLWGYGGYFKYYLEERCDFDIFGIESNDCGSTDTITCGVYRNSSPPISLDGWQDGVETLVSFVNRKLAMLRRC